MEKQVVEIIRDMCGAENIGRNSLLKEDLGFDSLNIIELIIALEEEFGIEFSASSLDPELIMTVGNVIGIVEECVGNAGNG